MTDVPAVYDADFFSRNESGSLIAARTVLGVLFAVLKAGTVVDIGCGLGTWLYAAEELGATAVLGIDGTYVDCAKLHISPQKFLATDLADADALRRTVGERKFDLAICAEVAEHLPATSAQPLVAAIGALSDIVLWSAAAPGQEGTGHINEQPLAYWVGHWRHAGFVPLDVIRPAIQDKSIEVWYAQNLVLFVREAGAKRIKALFEAFYERTMGYMPPLSFLHPAMAWKSAGLTPDTLDAALVSLAARLDVALRDELGCAGDLERADLAWDSRLGMVTWSVPGTITPRPILLLTSRDRMIAFLGLFFPVWYADAEATAEARRRCSETSLTWIDPLDSGVGGWASLRLRGGEPLPSVSLLGPDPHDASVRMLAREGERLWQAYYGDRSLEVVAGRFERAWRGALGPKAERIERIDQRWEGVLGMVCWTAPAPPDARVMLILREVGRDEVAVGTYFPTWSASVEETDAMRLRAASAGFLWDGPSGRRIEGWAELQAAELQPRLIGPLLDPESKPETLLAVAEAATALWQRVQAAGLLP